MSVHHSKPGRSKLFARLMLCSIVASMAILALSSRVSALDNLIVTGTVYDEAGNPLDGAHVVVTDTTTSYSDVYDSFGGGIYFVTIPDGSFGVGDTIEVFATYGEDQSPTNTSQVTAEMIISGMEVDVHFGTAIPQLGSSFGIAIAAGLVGLIAVVAVGVRRR